MRAPSAFILRTVSSMATILRAVSSVDVSVESSSSVLTSASGFAESSPFFTGAYLSISSMAWTSTA